MAKKRSYIRDLIKLEQRDIDSSVKKNGRCVESAFNARNSCPIVEALARHGHKASFSGFSLLHIGRTWFEVPLFMQKWQRHGVSGLKVGPLSFRISELERYDRKL